MRNRFILLPYYAITLKILAVFSFFNSVIVAGLTVYIWGKVSAYYDVVRIALQNLAVALQELQGNNSPASQLPAIPIWPLLLFIMVILITGVIIALTLWALGEWIEFRLDVAAEESKMKAMQSKTLNSIAQDISSVAEYFASLPKPRGNVSGKS